MQQGASSVGTLSGEKILESQEEAQVTISQLSTRMRERLARFLGNLCEDLCKRASVFTGEMVYGILASGSVVLTEVGRRLGEEIPLKQTEKRLSRNLARRGLEPVLAGALLEDAAGRIEQDTLLILDPTDICKPHARKMEHLATIRDGSEQRLGKGYWMVSVVAAHTGTREMIPLWSQVVSQESPDFISENAEIITAIRKISGATEGRGIWVIDRGGDRGRLFEELLHRSRDSRVVVRLRGNRHVLPCRGTARSARELAGRVPLPYTRKIFRERKNRTLVDTVRFGARKVRLPLFPKTSLRLVVLRLLDAGKPLFGIPDMPLYALSRGIAVAFSRHPRAPKPHIPHPTSQPPTLDL